MNETAPPSKRRKTSPLAWASGGTLMLHGAFLLVLWLWPAPPAKPGETLLEVDLKQDKPATPAPLPTTPPAKPHVVLPKQKPRPLVHPQLAKRTRLAKIVVPKKPIEKVPVVVPKATLPPIVTPTIAPPPAPVKKAVNLPKPDSGAPQKAKTLPAKPSPKKADSSPTDAPSAPSGGGSRRYALNPNPSSDAEPMRRSTAPAGADAGTNNRGHSDETAGAVPGVDLPRTRARRGRSSDSEAPPGSAPTTSKDGTEVEVGPSAPTGASGGLRRMARNFGDGADETGPVHGSGLPGGLGIMNFGNAKMGRGADEAAGNGGVGGSKGSSGRGSGRRGRRGSGLDGDPFGTGNGTGNGTGTGPKGTGGPGDGGTGNGPSGGTRLARRGLGDGDGDGTGDGPGGLGRGTGRGLGDGTGLGDGKGGPGAGGVGTGKGQGDGEMADGGSAGRARRGRGTHRSNDTEDEIGRGIWGGFKARFYQDKADHPDLPDATFFPGNPIDWPVFTKLAAQKTIPNLDFDWGETPPAPGMKSTFWSMKASGRIFVPKDDTYEFFFDELDDAGKLILDGDTIINVWQVQKSSPSSGKMFLKRGPHDIQIEYVQGPATAASIKLSWRSTSFPKETVGVYVASDK